MKNLKNIVIYSIIILLCTTAAAGYFIKSAQKKAPSQGQKPVAALDNTTKSTKTADSSAPQEEAVLIPTGSNITGKSEAELQRHVKEIMKKEFEKLDQNPVVGIGRGEDYGKAAEEAVNNAGGIRDIVKKGDVVLIKPNLCVTSEAAGSPMITDYRVVQKIIDIAIDCGASRVVVAEGNFFSNAFENKDNKYVSLKGVDLYNFNDCDKKDCYELTPQKSLVGKSIFIPKVYMDADVVIDVAKLKTHFITTVTLGLKNCIGVPSYKIYGGSGGKVGLHDLAIESVIIDINKIRKPDFTVIDGIVGGENFGPYANTPVKSNIIFAGKDIVAVDTVASTFMGFSTDDIYHIKTAADEKLGIGDLSKIKVKGADLNSIKMNFKPAN